MVLEISADVYSLRTLTDPSPSTNEWWHIFVIGISVLVGPI